MHLMTDTLYVYAKNWKTMQRRHSQYDHYPKVLKPDPLFLTNILTSLFYWGDPNHEDEPLLLLDLNPSTYF